MAFPLIMRKNQLDDGYTHGDGGLHPIPSILDLPTLDELEAIDISHGKSAEPQHTRGELRNRNNSYDDPVDRVKRGGLSLDKEKHLNEAAKSGVEAEDDKKAPAEESIRHDADVLTKVIVYSGIGWLATIGIPRGFAYVGLSV
ncbi:hypothetical protein P7C70_g4060, partial [Phenoliferia sp. Uapishka_3]